MIRFILTILFFWFSTSMFSQVDTLNQNQITIKRTGNQYEYWSSGAKFTGVIKVKVADTYCYQIVDKGILKNDGCVNIENSETVFVWSNAATDYDPDKSITFDNLKYRTREGAYRVFKPDSATGLERTLTLNGKEYNGYVRQSDTLYFYYTGKRRFLNTYYSNGNIQEYIETKNYRKNGLYVKYDEMGQISMQGTYSMDKKTGEWIEKNSLGILCVNNYVFGKKNGLNHCYVNDKLVLIEIFNYGNLAYYFDIEYRDNKVYHKKYDKEGNLLSTSIYRENQLLEYIPN